MLPSNSLRLLIILIFLLLAFLSGMFRFSFLGLGLVMLGYSFFALESSLPQSLWAGGAAGLVADTYGALPFGTHLAILSGLALLIFLAKTFLSRRYYLGDFVIIGGGVTVGVLAMAAASWFAAGFGSSSLSYLLPRALAAAALPILASLLFLMHRYRRETPHGEYYVV